MKTAKEYYDIAIIGGMLETNEESILEAIQMAIDDAKKDIEEAFRDGWNSRPF